MIKGLIFCLILFYCGISYGQEWSTTFLSPSIGVGTMTRVLYDGNINGNDIWKVAYGLPNTSFYIATVYSNTTFTVDYVTNLNGTYGLLAFEKFNGVYFLASTNQMAIYTGNTPIILTLPIPAREIVTTVSEGYLNIVVRYANFNPQWFVLDTNLNTVYNQTLQVGASNDIGIAADGAGNVAICSTYIVISTAKIYCGIASSTNLPMKFNQTTLPTTFAYSGLDILYAENQFIASLTRADDNNGSNYTKMYYSITNQSQGTFLSPQKNALFSIVYLSSLDLWYIASVDDALNVNWYQTSNLATLTTTPYFIINSTSSTAPLIYNFASNGNDSIALAMTITLPGSNTVPSISFHKTSTTLPDSTSSTTTSSSTTSTSSSSTSSSSSSSSNTDNTVAGVTSSGTSSTSSASSPSSTSQGVSTGTSSTSTTTTTQDSTTSTSTTESSNNTTAAAKDSTGGTDSVAIIAGVVGGVGFGIIVLLIVFLILFIRRRRNHPEDSEKILNNSLRMSVFTNAKLLRDIQIYERLGGGQFGDVFRGVWQGTTPVALKKPKSAEALAEIEQEVSVLLSLSHKNIVQFFGIYVNESQEKFMVTEYMALGSLSQLLLIEKVNEVDLTLMAKDAAAGMQYLASQGIVHRDLALRNLLVSQRTESGGKYIVKVADFGMSKQLENVNYYKSDTRTIPVKWSAPEVLNYGKFSTQSDVWSYGVVLWEMFSYGKTPYPGLSNAEAADSVLSGKLLGRPDNCPDAIYKLMLACWNQEADKRPDFTAIYQELDGFYRRSSPVPLRALDSLRGQYEFTGVNNTSQYEVVARKGKEEDQVIYHL